MKKFIVLYMMPAAGMAEWMQKPAEERKEAEEKMQKEWQAWATEHKDLLKETSGAGATQRVTKEGVASVKNDIMLYSIIEAESPEIAAKAFEKHPHLEIPGAWIDIMPANSIPGMSGN